jgi:hypothetical protein
MTCISRESSRCLKVVCSPPPPVPSTWTRPFAHSLESLPDPKRRAVHHTSKRTGNCRYKTLPLFPRIPSDLGAKDPPSSFGAGGGQPAAPEAVKQSQATRLRRSPAPGQLADRRLARTARTARPRPRPALRTRTCTVSYFHALHAISFFFLLFCLLWVLWLAGAGNLGCWGCWGAVAGTKTRSSRVMQKRGGAASTATVLKRM